MRSRASELERSTASGDALEAEIVQALASEVLEKWSRSGNDPTVLRGTELTWKTPGGGTETGFVGAVADR